MSTKRLRIKTNREGEEKGRREPPSEGDTLEDGPAMRHSRERETERGWGGRGEGRERGPKTPRERENNALKQQAATTLIGHFVHLFDLFKLWDN